MTSLSPVWSPDGQRIAYTRLEGGRGGVIVQTLATGATQVAAGAQTALNITPAFAPDGRTLAFAHSDESRHRHLHVERGRSLLRATLDRGTLR